jgi:hypothetical protein
LGKLLRCYGNYYYIHVTYLLHFAAWLFVGRKPLFLPATTWAEAAAASAARAAAMSGHGRAFVNFYSLLVPLFAFEVGLDIPLLACKHAYVTTERIPGIENMPNIR